MQQRLNIVANGTEALLSATSFVEGGLLWEAVVGAWDEPTSPFQTYLTSKTRLRQLC